MNLIRHMEIFDAEKFDTPIVIVGGGALGSWLALSLAKLGIEDITVYDFDVVEEHNIPNQAFGLSDIGRPKVKALNSTVLDSTGINIKVKNERYDRQRLTGIVFMMVDSMKERKRIWEESIKMKSSVKLLVEARMGLSMGRIYNVFPTDLEHIKKYEETLYGDENAEVSACGASMTVVTTAMTIASICARQLINYAGEVELDNEIMIDMMYNNFLNAQW